MKREQMLQKLGYTVPATKKKRVIVLSDIKNEADDHFAVMHHLLTPSHDVRGIVACHNEYYPRLVEEMRAKEANAETSLEGSTSRASSFSKQMPTRGTTTERSYLEGQKILQLANIDDIPLVRGSKYELANNKQLESEGADFIIQEALRDDPMPLYICMLGSVTDLAIAYLKNPHIAERLTAIWIGGGPYPAGDTEFNMMQDVDGVNVLFDSPMSFWQIPYNVYRTIEISFAELMTEVLPCGEIGKYLCDQMLEFHALISHIPGDFPNSEAWCLGDNPTVSVLMQSKSRYCWHMEKAPRVNADCTYTPNPSGREIRVYDSVDSRLTLSDFFSKMKLCYGGGN